MKTTSVNARLATSNSQGHASRRVRAGSWRLGVVVWVSLAIGPAGVFAQIQMPDPSEIHGRAIPASELAAGTVTVRVVREAIGNDITGQEVRVFLPDGSARTAETDDQGRAEFPDLPPGSGARAEATVDGEQLVSEPFSVPSSGGLRVILVAGLAQAAARREAEAAAAASAPPVSGVVVLGANSRVVMEFQDETLRVFYVLEVLNNARARVDIGGPLIIDLPTGAGGAAALQGSSPNTTVSGDRITVTGPFASGITPVQVGFQLDVNRPALTMEQRWPVALEQVSVAIEKVGELALSSLQFSTVGEVESEDGTPFLLASGPALSAGSTLRLELSNLPAHSGTPRLVALGLAAGILAIGGWLAFSSTTRSHDERRRLVDRRNQLLGELAAFEERHRKGAVDARSTARRQRMLNDLEQIYGKLDEVSPGPQGGGEGVAA